MLLTDDVIDYMVDEAHKTDPTLSRHRFLLWLACLFDIRISSSPGLSNSCQFFKTFHSHHIHASARGRLSDFWDIEESSFCQEHMSKGEWLAWKKALHWDEGRMATFLMENTMRYVEVHGYVTVNESMLRCCARRTLGRVYISSKPTPNGFKFWTLGTDLNRPINPGLDAQGRFLRRGARHPLLLSFFQFLKGEERSKTNTEVLHPQQIILNSHSQFLFPSTACAVVIEATCRAGAR